MPCRHTTRCTTSCSTGCISGAPPARERINRMQPFTGTAQAWNELIAALPHPHLLQTWEWSQVKKPIGWEPMPFTWSAQAGASGGKPAAAAMLLKRTIPAGGFARKMCVLYIPKGPNFAWEDAPLRARLLDDLQAFARRQGAIFVKLDPDVPLGTGVPGTPEAVENPTGEAFRTELSQRGWLFSQ